MRISLLLVGLDIIGLTLDGWLDQPPAQRARQANRS